MTPIPVSAAEAIAKQYGYDQVYIIARKVDTPAAPGREHVTTYGIDRENCTVAERVGNYIKHKMMGWPEYAVAEQPVVAWVSEWTLQRVAKNDGILRLCAFPENLCHSRTDVYTVPLVRGPAP